MNSEFHASVMQHWETLAEHYGYEKPVPANVQRAMQAILDAPTAEECKVAAERAKEISLVAILSAWAKGKISGPESVLNLEKRAKKADSLAKMLMEKGMTEAADGQRARAQEIRQRIKELLQEKNNENVSG